MFNKYCVNAAPVGFNDNQHNNISSGRASVEPNSLSFDKYSCNNNSNVNVNVNVVGVVSFFVVGEGC
jgi:hypothetical protein